MSLALADTIAGMAIDDKSVLPAGNQSNAERAVVERMAGTWTSNAVASRYVAAQETRGCARINEFAVARPRARLWMSCLSPFLPARCGEPPAFVCWQPIKARDYAGDAVGSALRPNFYFVQA
jgi:hypothetical protein